MIEHNISGSLQQWTLFDEKSKTDRWRGYIVARMSYKDGDRMKYPFLVFNSIRNVDDDWIVFIYLNAMNVWQGKFVMLPDEETAKKLMENLVKPGFKEFVECLAPLVPEDFEMPKPKKKGKSKKDEDSVLEI